MEKIRSDAQYPYGVVILQSTALQGLDYNKEEKASDGCLLKYGHLLPPGPSAAIMPPPARVATPPAPIIFNPRPMAACSPGP